MMRTEIASEKVKLGQASHCVPLAHQYLRYVAELTTVVAGWSLSENDVDRWRSLLHIKLYTCTEVKLATSHCLQHLAYTFLVHFFIFMSFCTRLIIFMPLIYIFQILTMKENNLLKIISDCLSRFTLLSVIFSSVKCWSWAGTLLPSSNVQSGISLCSSKAFCAGLFCLMPICHWSSPLLSSASCQLQLA